jgi:membrane fusion protein, multidrug efflux system
MRGAGRWIAGGVAGTVLIFSVLTAGGDRTPPAVAEPAVVVLGPMDTEAASLASVEAGVAISGSLEPHRTVEVRAQLAGTILRVVAERGQRVHAGEPLAHFDPAFVRSALAGAQAAVEAGRAAVESTTREADAADVLFEAGAVSARDLRQARSAAAAARGRLVVARGQGVEASEAASHARVVSPIRGVVGHRGVSAGEVVTPGRALFTVVDTDTLELAARVPAHRLAEVELGGRVVFSVDAYPGRRFEGSIVRIDPTVDASTRQVVVFVSLPNPDGALLGGLHAVGRIVGRVEERAITVPRGAVRGEGEGAHVLTVEDGRIVHAPVVLGPVDPESDRVAVRAGLAEGATVVTGPAGGLTAGTRVEVRPSRRHGVEEVSR